MNLDILTYFGLGILLVIISWFSLYFLYIELIAVPYFKRYVGPKKKIAEFSVIEKIRLIFYRRYQSYNIAAYFILILATILLLACIGVFLYANEFISKSTADSFNKEAYFLLVSAVTIRVGIIFIAFFIAQTLLKLYKYNLRMANFYTTLFDAIISHNNIPDIKETIGILTNPQDVGEIEKAPSQEILDLLKGLSETMDKKQ